MPEPSVDRLRTDKERLSRSLDDLRAGKCEHLSLAETAELMTLLKSRIDSVSRHIQDLDHT